MTCVWFSMLLRGIFTSNQRFVTEETFILTTQHLISFIWYILLLLDTCVAMKEKTLLTFHCNHNKRAKSTCLLSNPTFKWVNSDVLVKKNLWIWGQKNPASCEVHFNMLSICFSVVYRKVKLHFRKRSSKRFSHFRHGNLISTSESSCWEKPAAEVICLCPGVEVESWWVCGGEGCLSLGKLSQPKGLLLSSEMNRLMGHWPCEYSHEKWQIVTKSSQPKAIIKVIKMCCMFAVTRKAEEIATFLGEILWPLLFKVSHLVDNAPKSFVRLSALNIISWKCHTDVS